MRYIFLLFWLSLAGAVVLFLGRGPARTRPEPSTHRVVIAEQPRVAKGSRQRAAIAQPPIEAEKSLQGIVGGNRAFTIVQSTKTSAGAGALFTNLAVPRIQIEISNAGMTLLGGTDWRNGVVRPTVKATVREGEKVYTNVAVHLKGAAGSFRNIYDRPCLTLNFDKFAPGQSFHGLNKLSLNNSVQDGSYISEKICRELFEAAGVPVPRAGHAKVKLNGRDLGLYVLTEGFNKQFLKHYFKNTKGNLYDSGFLQDVSPSLGVNSGDNPRNHAGMTALIDAAQERDRTNRWVRLEKILDMDRFLTFIAMEVLQCHWDGYMQNINNWRVFHDLDANKMIFMPHGLDQMFGSPQGRSDPNESIDPSRRQVKGMVARAVLGTQEGRRRYFEKIGQLYTNVFNVDALRNRVDEIAAAIRPVIAESNMQWGRHRDFEGQVAWLKQRIEERGKSVGSQLNTVSAPLHTEIGAVVRPSGWRPNLISGNANFRQQRLDGLDTLYINAPNGDVYSSWRTRVALGPGSYRFEGKIRTRGVKPAATPPGTGAGLRIHAAPVPPQFSGNGDWRNFVFPFQVQEGGEDVQLICELRASKGEAWFDMTSLRVVRMQ